MKMPNKFYLIIKLLRLDSPTGYLLSFFPAMFGLLLTPRDSANLIYIPIFFLGSILARGAGCVINDILDQKFDKMVERTKNRPLASGALSNKEAFTVLLLSLSACLWILLSLTVTAISLGISAFFMLMLYPLMKRFTYFPQAFLGLTFNLGSLIAYASVCDDISYEALVIYIACGFWTLGYDTIYAFMDIVDDKKIGVKSTAIFFEKKPYKLFIALSYIAFIALFILANFENDNYFTCVIAISALGLLLWQVITLNIKERDNCLERFKGNNIVGFLLFIAMFLEYVI